MTAESHVLVSLMALAVILSACAGGDGNTTFGVSWGGSSESCLEKELGRDKAASSLSRLESNDPDLDNTEIDELAAALTACADPEALLDWAAGELSFEGQQFNEEINSCITNHDDADPQQVVRGWVAKVS